MMRINYPDINHISCVKFKDREEKTADTFGVWDGEYYPECNNCDKYRRNLVIKMLGTLWSMYRD